MLKPQDVVISIKLLQGREGGTAPTYAELASELKMSQSEVHAGVSRSLAVGLLRRPSGAGRGMPSPVKIALEEFLVGGVKYVWPGKAGPMVRGVPTGASNPAVACLLEVPEPDAPLVWRYPTGTVRGESITPLYPRVVEVCTHDPWLHEWLALVDILRIKTGREAALAATAIRARLA